MLPKIKGFIQQHRTEAVLVLVIVLAGFLPAFFGARSPYISTWDEAVHVNVVKNLTEDCCTPELHREQLGTDFRVWDDNHVWLHKPVLPFYLASLTYRLSESPFGLRLSGLLALLVTYGLLYYTARRYYGKAVAVGSLFVFSLSPYLLQLAVGRQFSGHVDLLLVAVATAALLALHRLSDAPTRRNFVAFGLVLGIAALMKSTLALAPFLALLAVVWVRFGLRAHLMDLLWSGVAALVVLLPERMYLLTRFPVEYAYELQVQQAHVYSSVEYWGRPWDFYLTKYLGDVISYLLAPLSLVSLIYGAARSRVDARWLMLTCWVLAYLLPLSLFVSKVSNFLVPALPALSLLVAFACVELWRRERFRALSFAALTVPAAYLAYRLNWFSAAAELATETPGWQRFTLLAAAVAAAGLVVAAKSAFLNENGRRRAAALLVVLAVLIAGGSLLSNNVQNARAPERGAAAQAEIRNDAPEIERLTEGNAVILVEESLPENGYLFVQYWSGRESFSVDHYHPVSRWLTQLPEGRPLYYLTKKTPGYRKVAELSYGGLYRLR